MSDTTELLIRHQRQNVAAGIYPSYAVELERKRQLWDGLASPEAHLMVRQLGQALRAELQVVPIVKHAACDQCLSLGKLAVDDETILPGSAVKVSVSQQDIAGRYTDSFTDEQLSLLMQQAHELAKVNTTFVITG